MRRIELLSPAKDAECGIEAIRHGADAVYIGAAHFGARAAAGNSVEDIARLCEFAHLFGAKVYVTINTILYDNELSDVEKLVWQLYEAGVDALIVQDAALLRLALPPIALHASTQMNNCTAEQVRFLEHAGFSQIVLARELSLQEISQIHSATSLPLEVFVHGALCVSYSGRCYASQHCFARSANRGRCAQFCRLAFDLVDADGEVLIGNKHLLSLRDMNRSGSVEEMLDAGVASFKIEGRLKSTAYVKNVTAYYRRQIDAVIARRPEEFCRSSYGTATLTFTPSLEKSFNRGFTDYFLHGKRGMWHNFDTPKAMGEYIGTVSRTDNRRTVFNLNLKEGVRLEAGDGLCFIDCEGKLRGFYVNHVEGNCVTPSSDTPLYKGVEVYRNADHNFEKILAKPSAERRLAATLKLEETPEGYRLEISDEMGEKADFSVVTEHEDARTPQADNVRKQLSKLGNTPFRADEVQVLLNGNRFIPSSALADWRREVVARLAQAHKDNYVREERSAEKPLAGGAEIPKKLDFTANIANNVARSFYEEMGVGEMEPAYELQEVPRAALMTCKYCLRYALGHCPKVRPDVRPLNEPLSLRTADGKCFPLTFDCKNCRMSVHASH